MPYATLRFGPFTLDPVRRSLRRDGHPVQLRPMAISLLCHLAEKRGKLVPKRELLETLWPDGSGTDANLTVTVAAVRKALGEVSGRHRILITVPREGYQFVAPVESDTDTLDPKIPRRLALPPIEIRGGDSREWIELVETIQTTIRDHTACIPGVEVAIENLEPTAQELSLEHFARAAGMEGVLVGTLERQSASARLELRIVDLDDQIQWHTQIVHPVDELPTLRLRAAREVSIALKPELEHVPKTDLGAQLEHTDAWRAYSEGRFHYGSGDGLPGLHRAAVAFQQAVDLDPTLAEAHAGLAEALLVLRTSGMAEADSTAKRIRTAATAAFQQQPLLPEAHLAMAQVCMVLEHNWMAAREHLMTALEFGPDNPWVHARYAIYLAWRRQFEASLDSIRRAQSLDPFSMRVTGEVAKIHYFAGQSGVALSILESATSRKLDFATGWMLTCWFHLGLGDGDAALDAIGNVRHQLEASALWDVFTGTAHGVAGRAELARTALDSLRTRRSRGETVPPQFEGMLLLSLRDFEGATECVRRSGAERYGEFPTIEADPYGPGPATKPSGGSISASA
jgi:DNA-binding winged helix-turn-helix (wHTH) protein/tetratricopeptide (TPR) repeat protein